MSDSILSKEPTPSNVRPRVQEPRTEHNVWFMTDALSPIAIALTRKILNQGDYVVLGVLPEELKGTGSMNLKHLVDVVKGNGAGNGSPAARESESDEDDDEDDGETSDTNWSQRFRIVPLDAR
jgi:hypothetical protein